ncbi:FAD binding domain-containing protein [Nemania sp. FL0916]|nr:FAD binding domain-containing protein [Nemania sp. FL0916]
MHVQAAAATMENRSEEASEEKVDVLILGGGTAGLCAGVWLARAGVSFRILERRAGMLANGQADGVQVRTVEIFESFGMSEELLKEAYHVMEATFWSDDADHHHDENGDGGKDGKGGEGGKGGKERKKGIRRTHSTADTEAGLSHLPHVILNQARINAFLTDAMVRASGSSHIDYGCDVRDVVVDSSRADDPEAHCVMVTAVKDGVERVYKAKYALGSDGAHSQVRKTLGFEMVGDSSDEVWGVMDVYPRTDFLDIRKKVIVRSESGTLLIIPREGDSLARMYINLSGGATAAKDVTLAQLQEKARQIFRPYTVDFAETAWWSAYVIGQRLSNAFHQHHRVFLSGDACHTHSPKAGQGMNVSLQDGYNLGWKLAAVLLGQASPSLLQTYVLERQRTAADLIAFDKYWSKLFSAAAGVGGGAGGAGITAELFVKAAKYTAGLATRYEESAITAVSRGGGGEGGEISRAKNLVVGMRFPSALVVRVGDARHVWLTRAMLADGRWHVVVFAGDMGDGEGMRRLEKLATDLEALIHAFTPAGADSDSVFNILLVLASKRAAVELEDIPGVFTPVTGKWKLRDVLKVFVDDEGYNSSHGHAYETYGIDPNQGALVVIRPDQYISRIGALDDVQGIETFFGGFLRRCIS